MAVSKKSNKTRKAASSGARATKTKASKSTASKAKAPTKRTPARPAKRAPARPPKALPRPASADFVVAPALAQQAAGAAPKHLLIFLPGFMGSRLKVPSGPLVWLDVFGVNPFDPVAWLDTLF